MIKNIQKHGFTDWNQNQTCPGFIVFGYFCSVFNSALKLNKRNRRGREEEAEKGGGGEEEGRGSSGGGRRRKSPLRHTAVNWPYAVSQQCSDDHAVCMYHVKKNKLQS